MESFFYKILIDSNPIGQDGWLFRDSTTLEIIKFIFFHPISIFYNPIYVLLWSTVLPAFIIPKFIKKIFFKEIHLPSYTLFSVSLIINTVLCLFFWAFFVVRRVYYEWDTITLPFTLFWHQSPALSTPPSTNNSSWMKEGWTKMDLGLVWLGFVLTIYLFSISFSVYHHRNHKIVGSYSVFLLISSFFMLAIGMIHLIFE